MTDGSLPVVGGVWRGKYAIAELISESADGCRWRGSTVDGNLAVVLRSARVNDADPRTQAWSKLGGIDSPHLQHARDAQRAGEWRIEVADVPKGVPLHEWRAARASVDPDTVKAIVAQLADALGAMHAFELVHLALSPEVVFIAEEGASLNCMIAGLDAMTTFDRKDPVPAAVNALYAPPEAHGLNVHVPGPGLCSWDWWSLGRIIQELVLGCHIVGRLTGADTRPLTSEIRAKAEELLVEADPKGPRAGAVEAMGPLDPQLTLLLRGLLTSAKESRWTGDNVDRWVRGLPVKEHYATPRADTHFRWRGRPCTVPEIAMLLQSAEHWAENSVQLFEATTPGTLAHFLKWSPSQSTAHQQLVSALELADSLPLKLSSPAAQREGVTIVALLQLSAGKLVWRGQAFESATVGAMMRELGEADGLMVLRALSTRSNALQIERIDAAAGRLLTELGKTVGDVEGVLRRYGWLAANDVEANARVFRLALEPIPALRAMREALAEKHAGSDHPAMEKLFKAQNVGRSELVILAWVSSAPERFKFYTHAEAARRRAEALRARGVEIIGALTWSQFERALNVGRILVSGWGWFILAWTLLGAAALVLWPGWRGPAFAAVPIVVALALRFAVAPRLARSLRESVPDAQWTWRDGPVRCRRELRVAGRGVAASALETELETVKKELGTLSHVQPAPAPLPALPGFGGVRAIGVLGWLVAIAFVGVGGWRAYSHPPSVKELKAAWAPPTPEQQKEQAKAAAAAAAATNAGKKAEGDEEVKISWPFKAGDEPVKLSVRSAEAATSAQVAYATKHGRDLVKPYRPDTISTLIIMPVPSTDGTAVMIFDGKRGELGNNQVYTLDFRPIPRTWVELNGRRGVFLDQ